MLKIRYSMGDLPTVAEVLLDLLRIVVTMIPAMTANTFAPFTGGGKPVDMGLSRKDGRRYLGDGKTWRGFLGGSISASILGLVLLLFLHFTGLTDASDSFWGPFPWSVLLIIFMAIGSLFGDMIGSFIKRALNRPRGTRTPLLDQWDYLIGTGLFILPFHFWWSENLISGYSWIALVLFLAVAWLAHTIANRIGYWIGVKKEPW
jgi:CDP-2,3-bis-(O-geranylgeranyl)-sn-glycerol synthase